MLLLISTFNMKYLNEPNMYEVYMLQLLQSMNVVGASLNVSKLMLKVWKVLLIEC